jgi:small subunit ribosomal protein S4
MAEEAALVRKYGLKTLRELWRVQSVLRRYRRVARELLGSHGPSRETQEREVVAALHRRGILKEGASLDDVLSLNIEDLLERRLQTQVVRRGLARSMTQARQLIVHGHIALGGRRARVPSLQVERGQEETLAYSPASPLTNDLHPVRVAAKAAPAAEAGPGAEE